MDGISWQYNFPQRNIEMMEKYYLIDWPDSQKFMHNKSCIQSQGMSYFVPCKLYDKVMSQPKG